MSLIRVKLSGVAEGRQELRLWWCRHFWSRLWGWRIRPAEITDGIWLMPCNCIHTFALAEDLDLIWLNRAGHIVAVEAQVVKNQVRRCAHAHSVIELPAGALNKLAQQ